MRVTCGLLVWLVVASVAGAQDAKPDGDWLIVEWKGGTSLISPRTGEVRPFDQRVPGPYWWPASKPYLVTDSAVIGSTATWQVGSHVRAVAYDAGENVMVLATSAHTLQFVPIDEAGGIGEVTHVDWPFACQPLGRLADGSVFGAGTGGRGDAWEGGENANDQLLITRDAETFCALVPLYEDGTALPPPGQGGTEVWTARPVSDGGFEVLYTVYTKIEGAKRGSSDLQGYRDVYTGTVPASWADKAVPPAGGKYLWKMPIQVKRFGLRIEVDCPPFSASPRPYSMMGAGDTIPLMSPTWDRLVWINGPINWKTRQFWPPLVGPHILDLGSQAPSLWQLTAAGLSNIATFGLIGSLVLSPSTGVIYAKVRQMDLEPLETDANVRRVIRIDTEASEWGVVGPPLLEIGYVGMWRLPVPGAPTTQPGGDPQ